MFYQPRARAEKADIFWPGTIRCCWLTEYKVLQCPYRKKQSYRYSGPWLHRTWKVSTITLNLIQYSIGNQWSWCSTSWMCPHTDVPVNRPSVFCVNWSFLIRFKSRQLVVVVKHGSDPCMDHHCQVPREKVEGQLLDQPKMLQLILQQ